MAVTSDRQAKINSTQVAAEAALSESLFTQLGSQQNYLLDERDQQETRLGTAESNISTNATNISNLQSSLNNVDLVSVGSDTLVTQTYIAVGGNYATGNGGLDPDPSLRHFMIQAVGTYKFVDVSWRTPPNTGVSPSITTIQDSGIAVQTNRVYTLSLNITSGPGGNFFWALNVFEAQEG